VGPRQKDWLSCDAVPGEVARYNVSAHPLAPVTFRCSRATARLFAVPVSRSPRRCDRWGVGGRRERFEMCLRRAVALPWGSLESSRLTASCTEQRWGAWGRSFAVGRRSVCLAATTGRTAGPALARLLALAGAEIAPGSGKLRLIRTATAPGAHLRLFPFKTFPSTQSLFA
jgi:hypothetical protein